MCAILAEGKANWHDLRHEEEKVEVYERFIRGYKDVVADWKEKFSDREIINITDDSDLDAFPKISVKEHFEAKGRRVA